MATLPLAAAGTLALTSRATIGLLPPTFAANVTLQVRGAATLLAGGPALQAAGTLHVVGYGQPAPTFQVKPAVISLVQQAAGQATSGTTVTVSLSPASLRYDALVVLVGTDGPTVVTVSDDAGNHYARWGSMTQAPSHGEIWYTDGITAPATVVTITLSASTSASMAFVDEFQGVADGTQGYVAADPGVVSDTNNTPYAPFPRQVGSTGPQITTYTGVAPTYGFAAPGGVGAAMVGLVMADSGVIVSHSSAVPTYAQQSLGAFTLDVGYSLGNGPGSQQSYQANFAGGTNSNGTCNSVCILIALLPRHAAQLVAVSTAAGVPTLPAATVVGQTDATFTSGSALAVTLSAPLTAGNILVAIVATHGASLPSVSTIVDNVGNSWRQLANVSTGTLHLEVWAISPTRQTANITGQLGNSQPGFFPSIASRLTVNLTATVDFATVRVLELAGVYSWAGSVDSFGTTIGGGLSISATTSSPAVGRVDVNDLILAAIATLNTAATVQFDTQTAGYSIQTPDLGTALRLETATTIANAIGAQTYGATLSPAPTASLEDIVALRPWTSFVVPLSAQSLSGDTLIAAIASSAGPLSFVNVTTGAARPIAVTDDAGNLWQLCTAAGPTGSIQQAVASGEVESEVEIWTARNAAPASTLTITFAGQAKGVSVRVWEYAGLRTGFADVATGGGASALAAAGVASQAAYFSGFPGYAMAQNTELVIAAIVAQDGSISWSGQSASSPGLATEPWVIDTPDLDAGAFCVLTTAEQYELWGTSANTQAHAPTFQAQTSGATQVGTAVATFRAATVPGAPGTPVAVAGNASATVIWTAPSDNGGNAVTGYSITTYLWNGSSYIAQSPAIVVGNVLSTVVTGLANGQQYEFTVAAINGFGLGSTNTSNAVTPSGLPTAPTPATATGGDTIAVVDWTTPSSTGGSAITGYVITPYIGAVAQAPITAAPYLLTYQVTGLINGTTYTFTVAAANANGTGASATTNAVTPAGVPDAPTNVVASATGQNDDALAVTWTAPSNVPLASITGYVVSVYLNGFFQFSVAYSGSAPGAIVNGIPNNQPATFTVAAVSAAGQGPDSAPSAAVAPVSLGEVLDTASVIFTATGSPVQYSATLSRSVSWASALVVLGAAQVPGPPAAVTAVLIDPQTALVTWQPPSGGVVQFYRVMAYIGATLVATHTGISGTSHNFGGLQPATTYDFVVEAYGT